MLLLIYGKDNYDRLSKNGGPVLNLIILKRPVFFLRTTKKIIPGPILFFLEPWALNRSLYLQP